MDAIEKQRHLDSLLQAAAVDMQAGRLAGAAARYRDLLSFLPGHAPILAALGNLALMQGAAEEALTWLERSVGADPRVAPAQAARAVALCQLGRHEQALGAFDRAIELAPNFAEAYADRGMTLHELGRDDAARADLERAIALKPELVPAHLTLGNLLRAAGEAPLAEACFDAALRFQADCVEALCNRGVLRMEGGRPDEALEDLGRAVALRPEYWEAHNNRGLAFKAVERHDEALASFERALAFGPNRADLICNRGAALSALGRYEEALACFDRAIALDAACLQAYTSKGGIQVEQGDCAAAVGTLDRARELDPVSAVALCNLGTALIRLGRIDEGMACFDRAIALDGERVDALANKGGALLDLGDRRGARECLERALSVDPECAVARWNRSLLLLSEGNFEEGWRLYEERWRTVKKAQVRRLDAPLWTRGGPLPVGTLLVHAEQGLGDVIQMSRYVAIAAESARVIVEAPAPLVPLLRTLADPSGRISVVASGETLPAFDAHCPVMSLPLAFGTKLSDIPASVPYLHPAPERRTHWAARLGERKRPRVGIAWSGSRIHGKDSERSLKLTQLGPLFALPIEFHALQTDVRDEDLPLVETLGIADHRGDLRDFADTAALAAELDLVVSVDTSVAHLAGALGLPVWILLADPAEFRWLHGRRDSPWYPSATLFRQPTRGAWSDVVAEVAQELARRFAFDPAAS